jgi:hypothetical protein
MAAARMDVSEKMAFLLALVGRFERNVGEVLEA